MIRELGTFERMALRTESVHPFNLVVVLNFEKGPDIPILRRALDYLQARHPILRAGISQNSARPNFFPTNNPIPFIRQRRNTDSDWQKVAASALNTGLNLEGPLLKCTFLQGVGPECDLVISFHHAIVDAASVHSLVVEFLAAIKGLARGETMHAPNPYPLPNPPETSFPRSFRSGRGLLQVANFAVRQSWNELIFRARFGSDSAQVHADSHCHVLCRSLSGAETGLLVDKIRRKGLTMHSVLNAAQLLVVCTRRFPRQMRSARTLAFTDLRPRLDPPVPAGQIFSALSMMRVELGLHHSEGILDAAAKLNRSISQSLKRGDPYAAYRMSEKLVNITARLGRFRLGHSALSYTGSLSLETDSGPFRLAGVHGFISNNTLGPRFASQCRIFAGRLFLDFVYLDGDMDKGQAEELADEMISDLNSL